VKADPYWKKYFEELKRRMHPNRAIVAIARHLLTVVWYVLTRHEPYSHYSPERIAYKYPEGAQVPDLVVGVRRRTAAGHDPPAVRALLPDAARDWG
jgi:hypothetical protein